MALDDDQPQRVTVRTRHCGNVDVHVTGDVRNVGHKPVFLTVHDFGSNANSFDRFIFHPSMLEVRQKSVWLNFELPGQGMNALELPSSFKFPSLDDVAEDLTEVLEHFKIECVVGFGEGAGANILCRFAMAHPTKISGLILVHPTATSAGFMEWAKEKLIKWNMHTANPTAEEYLVMYKFGSQMENTEATERQRLIQQYVQEVRNGMNHKNMFAYMDAFLKRAVITSQLRSKLKCDCMIISGSKGSFLHTVETMHAHMNPQTSTFVKIDGVADALLEAPEQVTRSLLLFCKGLGMLTTVYTPAERASTQSNQARDRNRISMHDADMPRGVSPSRSPITQ